jgi:hypothetical protein
MNTSELVYLQPWKAASNYIGEDWTGFYVGLSQTRDSSTLTRANFLVFLKRLEDCTRASVPGTDDECTVQLAHERHWACGWVEVVLIHESDTHALALAEKMVRQIEEAYPCLCEHTWSLLESEEAASAWRSMSLADRIEACKQFDCSIFAARRKDDWPDDPRGELTSWLADGC